MKYKISFFCFIAIIFSFVLFQKGLSHRDAPLRYSINLNDSNFPIINVYFNGNAFPCQFNTGSCCLGKLNEEAIKKIKKTKADSVKFSNHKGLEITTRSFFISKLKFADQILKDVNILEKKEFEKTDSSILGEIGNPILKKTNLLLDFPHLAVWTIPNIEEIPKAGFDPNKFFAIPFEYSNKGIIFNTKTDFGIFKFSLCTCANPSFLRSSIIKELDENALSITSDSFILGGKNFGKKKFLPMDFSPNIPCDGILGMDFLLKHVVYIDFPQKKLYFSHRYSNYSSKQINESIDVLFTSKNIPILNVRISGKDYPFILDLGASNECSISKKILEKNNFHKLLDDASFDFLGNSYFYPNYYIPKVQIGNVDFHNIIGKIEDEEFHENCIITLKTNEPEEKNFATFYGKESFGSIGHPFFNKTNFLLDFPHSKIFLIHNIEHLNENLTKSLKYTIPFSYEKLGIVITADTDMGQIKLLIDSGSSKTLLHDSDFKETDNKNVITKYISSDKFILGNTDFGKRKFYYLHLTELLCDIDGILGMDFLKNHMIFVDYQNQKLLISDPIDPI